MKAMSAGVTFSAAMVRSPSFSRSSSSQTTTMRPARISSSASSMLANGSAMVGLAHPLVQEALDVFRDHVHFDVDHVAHALEAERGQLGRVGDQGDAEAVGTAIDHRQADAVEGYEALGHDVA